MGSLTRATCSVMLCAAVAATACTDAIAPSIVPSQAPLARITRDDSIAQGYFARAAARLRVGRQGPLTDALGDGSASIVSVTPGWFQGYTQPNAITAVVSGPVNSVTVTGSGAIQCSGHYGTLIAYDKDGAVVGSTRLSLIDESDCGDDLVTFGAQATVTTTAGVIASFQITPMSPTAFSVYGDPGGRASETFSVALGAVKVDQPPVARFYTSCIYLSCSFNALPSSDDNGIVSYVWDLGKSPGGSATGPLVSTDYPHDGQRTVTLTVTDAKGQTNSTTQTFTVSTQPILDLRVQISCVYLTCTFTSSSIQPPGIVRAWDFGDGATAGDVIAPTHTYAAAGNYSVSFKVGPSPVSIVVYNVPVFAPPPPPPVDAPPVAQFNWSCQSTRCTLDAAPSTDDKGIVSYLWNLDKSPGGSATTPIVTVDYPHTGPRSVSLTVTDASGQTNTITKAVTVP